MLAKNLLTISVATLALGIPGMRAAVFPRVTAEELTAQSQAIVEGNIVRSWTAWDTEHKYIWTHYEISVADYLRGSMGGTFTVSEPGGSLDGLTQQISGSVSYAPGETTILFLYQTPIGYWRSVGGPQGKFTVDNQGRVHGSSQANTFIDTPGAAAGTSLGSLEGMNLRDFKTRVRGIAAIHPFRGQR